jgi:hypothetical protein
VLLKITFIDPSVQVYDPVKNPYHRIASDEVTDKWTEDPEVRGRYLGYMVWMHYWLYRKYNGKVKRVPHPHIELETKRYRIRQDIISTFLAQRLVKTANPEDQTSLIDEVHKYITWYASNHGGVIPAKGITEQLQNSSIGGSIKNTSRGYYLTGYRFLDAGESPADGESFAMQDIYDIVPPADNFGIPVETPEQYYERLCTEYDKYKDIFTAEPTYDIDLDAMPDKIWADDKDDDYDVVAPTDIPNIPPREDNLEISGQILPSGVVIRKLEEPSVNALTREFHGMMEGYLPVDEDSDCEEYE